MGVLSEVRAETHAVHQSLDDHPLLVQFMSQAKIDAYRGFLMAFYRFLKPVVSQAVDPNFLPTHDQNILQYQTWLDAVRADLCDLDVDPDSIAASELTLFENVSQFWGLLYVLEGSVLGGTQVAATLPPTWPSSFLKRGAQARLRWPYFCRRIGEMEGEGAIEGSQVQKGAIQAFRSMISIFDGYLKGGFADFARPGSKAFSSDPVMSGDMG